VKGEGESHRVQVATRQGNEVGEGVGREAERGAEIAQMCKEEVGGNEVK
jgi:hypothetical protein